MTDDLISRAALLAAYDAAHKGPPGGARKLMVDASALNQWISVKDMLPESGVHVILCCEIHSLSGAIRKQYVCDGYYAAPHSIADCYDSDNFDAYDYDEEEDNYYLKEGWYEVIYNWDDYSSVVIGDFVTHWMPLPEPPKEDDDGE